MNNNIIIAIIVVVLVAAGAFFVINNNDDDNDTDQANNQTNQQQSNDANPVNGQTFNPLATVDQSFVATINGTSSGEPFNGTIEYDGQGNVYFSGTTGGAQSEFYVADDQFIACQEGSCIAFPADQSSSNSPFDVNAFNYTDEEFNDFRNNANYVGMQSCPAGTCNVWEVTDENGFVSSLFLDTNSNRISRVEANNNGDVTTLEYDFRPVTITLPEDVQTFDSLVPAGV